MSTLAMLVTSRAASGFHCARPAISKAFYHSCQSRLFSCRINKKTSGRLFAEEVNIIYDSKCNVCNIEIEFLRRRDEKLAQKRASDGLSPQPRLRFTDLESGNYNHKDPANGGVTYEIGMASMHAVTADGKVMKGVPVFRLAYEQVNLGWLFAVTKFPFVKKIADNVYNMFAKYRTQITRGETIESLVKAYREKKAVEQKQKAADCEACNEKTIN